MNKLMKEELRNKIDEYLTTRTNLMKDIEAEIRDLLGKVEGRRVAYNVDLDDDIICISYDGGNHPGYNSTCFSSVYAVYLNDRDEICLVVEDDDTYSIDRIWSMLEIIDVLEFVESKVNPSEEC